MPSTTQIIESENYKRLERNYPKLKDDREHRRKFHDYLNGTYIRGVDKPVSYDELERAYRDFHS